MKYLQCIDNMLRSKKIVVYLLCAFAISLSSCVTEIKNTPSNAQDTSTHRHDTTQYTDSISHLIIVTLAPDSNSLLDVKIRADIKPQWKKWYRLDWKFGDSTEVFSKFDTNIVEHLYRKWGTYTISLSVLDTVEKKILAKTSIVLDLQNNEIDTNSLHQFTKIGLTFYGQCNFTPNKIVSIAFDSLKAITDFTLNLQWSNKHFVLLQSYDELHLAEGDISNSGNLITGWYRDSTGTESIGQHTWNFSFFIKYIEFADLKRSIVNNDSMVYFESGVNLSSQVISLVDTAFSFTTTILPPGGILFPWVYTRENINWSKQPSPFLKITFYK